MRADAQPARNLLGVVTLGKESEDLRFTRGEFRQLLFGLSALLQASEDQAGDGGGHGRAVDQRGEHLPRRIVVFNAWRDLVASITSRQAIANECATGPVVNFDGLTVQHGGGQVFLLAFGEMSRSRISSQLAHASEQFSRTDYLNAEGFAQLQEVLVASNNTMGLSSQRTSKIRIILWIR